MDYETILERFNIKKRYQNKAQAICPCHDDKTASLTISKGDRGTLLHCHAGCSLDSILEAVRLKKSDLFYDKPVYENTPRWIKYVERCAERDGKRLVEYYHYHLLTGEYAFTRLRYKPKDFRYGILKDGRFTFGLNGLNREQIPAVYGSLKAVKKAIKNGNPVFICEGEKDTNTISAQGFPTVTCGAVSDWRGDCVELFKNANVIMLAHNDPGGMGLASRIKADLQGIAKSVKIVVPCPETEKADITDYFNAGHTREDFEKLISEKPVTKTYSAGLEPDKVMQILVYKIEHDQDGKEKSKKVVQSVKNHEIVLENDLRFAGKICFDEFARQIYLMGNVPWEKMNNFRAWSNFDDSAAFSILQSDYGLSSRNDFFDAIKNTAKRHRFHPVKDLLDSLKWDGTEHIRPLLPEYLGAEDSEFNYQVMRLWMLGAVARIYQPGCKFDYTMILQGKQGIGKSTFLQLMAMNDFWFSDSLDSLDGDRAAQGLLGTWIVELAELKSLARTAGGIESVKRFLSANSDRNRLPYERRAEVFLRQNVFAGTTNKFDFLQDETGNRRFLIVETGVNEPVKSLFESGVVDDIKAAWAQAVSIWHSEHPKLILPKLCAEQASKVQEQYLSDDGKTGLIEQFLADKQRTCVLEVWRQALQENGRPQKWQSSEISSIILALPGWERMKNPAKFGEYGSQRGFQKNYINKECRQEFLQISDDELKKLPFD